MADQGKDNNKERKLLKPYAEFQNLVKLIQNLALRLNNFDQSNEPCDLDEFVELADPGNSNKWISIGADDKLKREDRHDVNNKPPSEIGTYYFSVIINNCKCFVLYCRTKVHKNVN